MAGRGRADCAGGSPRPRSPRWGRHLLVVTLLLAFPLVCGSLTARLDESVQARGQIDFLGLARVTTRVAARIEEVHCREGRLVRQGDLLITLDDVGCRAARNQLVAEIDAAEKKCERLRGLLRIAEAEEHPGEVATERAKLETLASEAALATFRKEKLEGLREIVSSQELEAARRDFDIARSRRRAQEAQIDAIAARHRRESEEYSRSAAVAAAELQVLQAKLPLAERDLEATKVFAPIDGWILTANSERLKGTWATPGATIVEIADPARLQFVMPIDERDISKVRPGQTVIVNLDAFPYYVFRPFRGTIAEVSSAPIAVDSGRKGTQYRALVKIADGAINLEVDGKRGAVPLRPGLSGEGVVIVNRSISLARYLFRSLAREVPGSTTVY